LNAALVLLALTSVPLGILGITLYRRNRDPSSLAGIAGAAWAISGVALIYMGIPGTVFFPGMLAIVLAGVLMRVRSGERSTILLVKLGTLCFALVAVSIGLVFL